MSEQQGPQSGQTTADSPGQLLRRLREQQQLTVTDIAKRIHLEPKIIEAIEHDDYSQIPTATYARGYLRSYAKTLEADADHIVSLYNTENEAPPPEILPEVKPPSQVSSSDKPVKAFTYLITLGLFLLILIWYQSNYIVGTEAENIEPTEQQSSAIINNTDATFDVVVHPDGWQSPATEIEEPEAEKPEVDELEEKINAESAQLSITEQMSSLESMTDTDVGEPVVDDQQTVAETTTIVSTGEDRIVFEISQDSWLEVYDNSDNRLFMNLAKQGETIEVTGTAPFSLIIGYSPGVTLKFNDESFDAEPYSNNGVARFTLPAEE